MKSSELTPQATSKTIIYLDMDGVLADFFSEYAKMAGFKTYRDIPAQIQQPTLDKMMGSDFFFRLPKFPTTDNLVDLVLNYVQSYSICSSPLRGDHVNSEKWKRLWIKKSLQPQPARIIITPNKSPYASQSDGTPNILIDDRGSNIDGWRSNSGIGIKYQADEDPLSKVKKELDFAYKTNEEVYFAYPYKIGEPYGKKNLSSPHLQYKKRYR